MTFGEPDLVPTHWTEYEQLVGSVCATVTVASRPAAVKCPVTVMT